jgi:hypothetical protein
MRLAVHVAKCRNDSDEGRSSAPQKFLDFLRTFLEPADIDWFTGGGVLTGKAQIRQGVQDELQRAFLLDVDAVRATSLNSSKGSTPRASAMRPITFSVGLRTPRSTPET